MAFIHLKSAVMLLCLSVALGASATPAANIGAYISQFLEVQLIVKLSARGLDEAGYSMREHLWHSHIRDQHFRMY